MCPGCGRLWTAIHVLWSIVYISCGAAQLVAGIFFFISIPEVRLTCNIFSGSVNIIMGIASGMVACFGRPTSRRQETLLYIAVCILTVNVINGILNEWCFYWTDMSDILAAHPHQNLLNYASFATRIPSAVVIATSFLDSQFAFCTMQVADKRPTKKLSRSNEQVSDIEYIIPRMKPSTSKSYSVYNAYAQSWVFDAETANCSNPTSSPYLKLPQNGTPTHIVHPPTVEVDAAIVVDASHLVDNPVVHIEEASDPDDSNSDRKLNYMKSFSRTASPVVLSASSSQISLNINAPINQPPIYECLERLTEPSVYRSRLNSALSSKEEEDEVPYHSPQPAMFRRVEALTPQGEKVQYASLMKELTKAIGRKKEPNSASPPSASSTASEKTPTDSKECSSSRHESTAHTTGRSNSDAEFSKELEAALQLIQDLESPNTLDTPSEPKLSSSDGREARPLSVWRSGDVSESEKTLSAIGSLGELSSPMTDGQPELGTFKPAMNGKGACVVVGSCESQSTSGYSSPTHKSSSHTTPSWSAASSINGSNNDLGKALSYTIHNTKSAAVISLYNSPDTIRSKPKSITLVTITGNNQSPPSASEILDEHRVYAKNETNDHPKSIKRSSSMVGVWNVKSILRKKKQGLPKLCPELEGAIVKSESLAYLSELELLARHQRNNEIERQIEQRVLQQLGVPRTESNC